jgi:hypothetical protein
MCLHKRDLLTCVGYVHSAAIENGARSARGSNVALKRMKIQAFNEPSTLRPKRKWQTADRHQTCDPDDSLRARRRFRLTRGDIKRHENKISR